MQWIILLGFFVVAAAILLAAVTYCFSIVVYVLLHCYVYWGAHPDLRQKYSASWALVTGASSGIGLALANALARDGFNVVLIALPDEDLTAACENLQQKHTGQRFIPVGVDLADPDGRYLSAVEEATADIAVQLVFLNAGYCINAPFLAQSHQEDAHQVQVNLVSTIRLAQHFTQRMVADRLKGALVLTSSMSAHIPCPFAAVYAATKAALTSLGSSLAVELAPRGIDVTVAHPGPTLTRFFDSPTLPLEILESMKKIAMRPEDLTGVIFRAIGRLPLLDVGPVSMAAHLFSKMLDGNLQVWLLGRGRNTEALYKQGGSVGANPHGLQALPENVDNGASSTVSAANGGKED